MSEARGGGTSSTCGQRHGALWGRLDDREVPSGSYARWTFEAPTNTTIVSVTIHRTAGGSAFYAYWGRSYFLFLDAPVLREPYGLDHCAAISGPCPRPGDPAAPLSDTSRFTESGLRGARLIASAQCDGPNPCPPQGLDRAGHFSIHRAQIGLADASPPVFRVPPSGGLLDHIGAVGGKRAVTFDGSDLGGGIRAAEVLVDGVTRAQSPIASTGSCREPFTDPVPCPLAAAGTMEFDTSALDNGERTVQVALVDAAGNRTLSEPVSVHIHNDKGPNGAGASRVARLRARFQGGRKTERRLRFGRTTLIKGRLVDGANAPIRGAKLQVYARLDRLGARERPVATVKTGPNGRFRWIAPRGPSRFIRFAYRTYESDEGAAASTALKLNVGPKIALSVKPRRVQNRGQITFRGRLVGGPGKAGAQLTIEAVGRDVRSRVPVTTLRTDPRGRFRFSYRFLRSFAPFTYRFRARLMRQASYPYAAGASRIVTVRIVR
jgi:hypothetical protein